MCRSSKGIEFVEQVCFSSVLELSSNDDALISASKQISVLEKWRVIVIVG
jgi:hypothetical protein